MGGEEKREPIDFPKNVEDELNCDVWGLVDFGLGPVFVRCTRMGFHIEHMCKVLLTHE